MSLKTYSWLAVLLAVTVVAVGWFGIAGTMAAIVAAACVAAHVAGNAIGTSLRDATDRRLPGRPESPTLVPSRQPPTLLERGESLGRLVPVSAGIGALCGGAFGTAALVLLAGSSPAGAVLGGVSSAVIGGIGGFLLASFVEILRAALREAEAREQPGGSPPRSRPGGS